MPTLLPTPDELRNLTPAQRNKIRRAIARIALELDHTAADLITAQQAERAREAQAEGERIRAHARTLQAMRPPEPPHVTEARRRTLLDNTR